MKPMLDAMWADALLQPYLCIDATGVLVQAKEKCKVRQAQSKPIVDAYFTFCRTERKRVLDESPMVRAIQYSLNQEDALRRFLEDGRLPLHNSISELQLRREAVGRVSWLFVGSDDAAAVNATFVSILASCQMHGVEPWSHLVDLFCLLPSWPMRRVLELSPAHIKQTLEQDDAQQKLKANIYRQILRGTRS